MNRELRKKIVHMITDAGEGHIPSSFSIVDIIAVLYEYYLKFNPQNPDWEERDYFILSKGHGCAAFYVVLAKHGFISQKDLDEYGRFNSILGGHPDRNFTPLPLILLAAQNAQLYLQPYEVKRIAVGPSKL